jgi:predicted transcriptional regulator of viral defense system
LAGLIDRFELNTRVKRGLYRKADAPMLSHQGFIDIGHAVPEGVICLLSALSYYELTTFNPSFISIALRRGSRKPKISYPPVEIHHFSDVQFSYGITIITLTGHKIKIYSREKTLADCLRYRNRLGIDIVKEGLSEYLKRKDRNIEELMECARICRVRPLLHTWLLPSCELREGYDEKTGQEQSFLGTGASCRYGAETRY